MTHEHSANELYLGQVVDWVLYRIDNDESKLDFPIVEPNLANETEQLPFVELLAQRFGLSVFEKQCLLLVALYEFNPSIAKSIAQRANGNEPCPTFGLCLSRFDQPSWDVLSPARPLLQYRLVEINRIAGKPLVECPIVCNSRVANFIKGISHLDPSLEPFLTLVAGANLLGQSQVEAAKKMVENFLSPNEPPVQGICVVGTDTNLKQQYYQYFSELLDSQIFQLDLDLLPSSSDEITEFALAWQRERRLGRVGLVIKAKSFANKAAIGKLNFLLNRVGGFVLVESDDAISGLDSQLLDFDPQTPTVEEQQKKWMNDLPAMLPDEARVLTGQFDLNMSELNLVTQKTARVSDQKPSDPLIDIAWNETRKVIRPTLSELATRIDAKATWDDIVLPDGSRKLVKQIIHQVRARGVVLDDWGFRKRVNRGLGIAALFAGESGTGKTMAAEVIANELSLDLYRIDLSRVVSKWVGESEANLRKLLDAMERGGGAGVLLFDEADSLFGRRQEVQSSNDRFANLQTNYLLQRIETFRGLAILATNNKSAIDSAFRRRLRFVVDFEFPEFEERRRIWQTVFPKETPVEWIDWDGLARLRLTGGNIYSIAFNAACAAASASKAIGMEEIVNAASAEFAKSQQPFNPRDSFCWGGGWMNVNVFIDRIVIHSSDGNWSSWDIENAIQNAFQQRLNHSSSSQVADGLSQASSEVADRTLQQLSPEVTGQITSKGGE